MRDDETEILFRFRHLIESRCNGPFIKPWGSRPRYFIAEFKPKMRILKRPEIRS